MNKDGEFNAPFNGRLLGKSFDEAQLREVSDFLKTVTITNDDFETVCAKAAEGDFVYIDSPYVPIKSGSFTGYTADGFSMGDHIRLAECCDALTKKGVYFMMSNSDASLVKSLYAAYNMKTVDVARRINCNGANRKATELIITNY